MYEGQGKIRIVQRGAFHHQAGFYVDGIAGEKAAALLTLAVAKSSTQLSLVHLGGWQAAISTR